jgi:hypothetical protein
MPQRPMEMALEISNLKYELLHAYGGLRLYIRRAYYYVGNALTSPEVS